MLKRDVKLGLTNQLTTSDIGRRPVTVEMYGVRRIGMRQVVDELKMGQETMSQEQRSFASSSFAGVGGSAMSASGGGSMGMSMNSLIPFHFVADDNAVN